MGSVLSHGASGWGESASGQTPVVVVGAGPVGQTAAALLRRAGHQVLLFDARAERDPVGSKAICQARDVLDVWETVGVGAALACEGVTWETARTFYRDREIASWRFQDRGRSSFPAFVNIGQERTEERLDEALADLGVTTIWGHSLDRVTQDEDGVVATFATSSGPIEVPGAYVVLATGARSDVIRADLGLSFDGESFSDKFLICDIRAEIPGWETERRFYFDPPWNPGRQVLIHACPDSTFRIDWQVPADYNLDIDEESGGLDRRIRQIVGDRPYTIVWKSLYRFHSRHTDRMRLGRVLLAGDIAHLVSPFGARGLNTGVFDAENAAWKLDFMLRGWGGPGLLESYDAERMAATRENIAVTGATMRFLVPQDEAEHRERARILEEAAADPVVAASVDSGRFAEPFWYVDSPLTTPDLARPFAGRPERGHTPTPAPGVLLPDLGLHIPELPQVTRLRELVRGGLSILAAGADVLATIERAAKEATDAPVRAIVVDELDVEADVREVLGMRAGEAWIIRPDAYVAAVVSGSDQGAITAALRRVLGF
ncbi:MAG: FAD-dependent monooxygenase [Nocardioides sp.]|uniref:FAD-dependent monooxygenase n=1 Tax=Nocardioides sp. TaxID=35761 RepID=UPI0039E67B88